MTEVAGTAGCTGLVMSVEEWKELVVSHLRNPDITAFSQEVFQRVGDVKDLEELNRWMGLAMNIWNATPQPDRGGRTAYELSSEL